MADNDIDKRFDKIDQQLDRIATTIVKRFDRIDKALDTKADSADLQRALGLLDSLSKRLEIWDHEKLVMANQLM